MTAFSSISSRNYIFFIHSTTDIGWGIQTQFHLGEIILLFN